MSLQANAFRDESFPVAVEIRATPESVAATSRTKAAVSVVESLLILPFGATVGVGANWNSSLDSQLAGVLIGAAIALLTRLRLRLTRRVAVVAPIAGS
jgi:hypothetical protein